MSAILIRLVERALVRLKIPATPTDRDKQTFDALLQPDEQGEVWRRYSDIKHIRDLMAAAYMTWDEWDRYRIELDNYNVDLYWMRREWQLNLTTRLRFEKTLPAGRKHMDERVRARQNAMDHYLNQGENRYDSLSPLAKRHILPFRRPVTCWEVLQRQQTDRDLILWPNDLTALQQAYKEVLSQKLNALKS